MLKRISGCLLTAAGVAYFFYLQIGEYSLPIDVVLFLCLGAVGMLSIGFRAIGLGSRKAAMFAVAIWAISVAAIRVVTPRVILHSLWYEASSIIQLKHQLWDNTRGMVHITWHTDDVVFPKPVVVAGESLDRDGLQRALSEATGRQCAVFYRVGYWDFGFRIISVGVEVEGAYNSTSWDELLKRKDAVDEGRKQRSETACPL